MYTLRKLYKENAVLLDLAIAREHERSRVRHLARQERIQKLADLKGWEYAPNLEERVEIYAYVHKKE